MHARQARCQGGCAQLRRGIKRPVFAAQCGAPHQQRAGLRGLHRVAGDEAHLVRRHLVVAADRDPRALACARENLSRLGLDGRVEVVQAELILLEMV